MNRKDELILTIECNHTYTAHNWKQRNKAILQHIKGIFTSLIYGKSNMWANERYTKRKILFLIKKLTNNEDRKRIYRERYSK